jgi:tRNA (guanine6-N2)-methyltransferase
MPKRRPRQEPLPPLYAVVFPGLEPVAESEIAQDLGGEVKKTGRGLVVFRAPAIDASLLELRTTEDVFLLAWGTDTLSYRAADLDQIRRWTAHEADWDRLLRLHHAVRPKPKGKPTFRLVTQMTGEHGYLRRDARKALADGLAGKLPASWRHVEENAAIEIWLTIQGATAVCGLRLSDRRMRHRPYKIEHLPASLRPTIAAAMARLADVKAKHAILDPMCGAGTILAEIVELTRRAGIRPAALWGGDLEPAALRAAAYNIRRLGRVDLVRWDATRLPLPDASFDRLVCNLPFGKQLSRPEEIRPLYRDVLAECDRVLRPYSRAVLLASDWNALKDAAFAVRWKREQHLRVRVLGQWASLCTWIKTTARAASSPGKGDGL